MVFLDYPTVDESSKASEESIIIVRSIFTRRNGFILREEKPDYGVDFEAELVEDLTKATGRKISLQIKSKKKINIIRKEKTRFISIQFSTSRLGYLCRKLPAYGIIIIYDDNRKICYYDFAEEIISRITLQRGNDKWKQNGKVNINIPANNILNNEAIKEIYQKVKYKFENLDRLIIKHGDSFRVKSLMVMPTEDSLGEEKDSAILVSYLEKYGFMFLDMAYYNKIYHNLTNLSFKEIDNSPKLQLLSSITYYQIGLYLESDYYIKRCKQNLSNYSKNEKIILKLTDLKVNYHFGNINSRDYLKKLTKIRKKVKNKINLLTINLDIVYLKILANIKRRKTYPKILNEIDALFDLLYKLDDIEETRWHIINLTLSDFIHQIGLRIYRHHAFILKLRIDIGIYTPLSKRIEWFHEVDPYFQRALKNMFDSYNYGIKSENELIKAYSILKLASAFFITNFVTVEMQGEIPLTESRIKMYNRNFQNALRAHDTFINSSLFYESYNAITIAYEIQQLFKVECGKTLGQVDKEIILERINQVESKIGIKKFTSLVEKYEKAKVSIKPKYESIVELKEQDIETFASTVLETYDLTSDRSKNIKSEIYDMQYFYTNRNNPDLVLQQDLRHTLSKDTMYKEKVLHLIKCNKCGKESILDSDIKKVLVSINKHKCA